MRANVLSSLDDVDWAILTELQRDGRLPFTELSRRVHRDLDETVERVRRLESAGFITGYRATVNMVLLGFPILAFIRLEHIGFMPKTFDRMIAERREILECFWIASDNYHLIRVAATSTSHLNDVIGALSAFGTVTISITSKTKLRHRGVSPPLVPEALPGSSCGGCHNSDLSP